MQSSCVYLLHMAKILLLVKQTMKLMEPASVDITQRRSSTPALDSWLAPIKVARSSLVSALNLCLLFEHGL